LELPAYFEYLATFLWAMSGALLGARKGYAILGIITVAIVSSAGGGLLRDGLFIQDGPPALLRTPTFLSIIGGAVLMVLLFGKWIQGFRHFPQILAVVDAIGLGAYAVVGMNRAFAANLSIPGVVLVGMVNAVVGGILRDVLMRNEPNMFKPGTLEEVLALMGCIVFVIAVIWFPQQQLYAAWATIALVFIIRMLAVRYEIQSKPLSGFEKYWNERDRERQ
jgi:uncharacterized membrane protein YeiH